MNFSNLFKKWKGVGNVYDNLSQKQKLAVMCLMGAFGSTCSGTEHELNKINNIMSSEGQLMGISADEMHRGFSMFNDMEGMVETLVGSDHDALSSLFWSLYRIVAVGKSEQAVQVLLGVYNRLGFSEQDCISILENKTGISQNEL